MSREEGGRHSNVAEMYEDPVCGMEVNAADAKYTMESGGVVYYFCSQECMDEYRSQDLNPEEIDLE